MSLGQYIYALTLAMVGLGCWLYASRSEHEHECRRWLAACLLMAAGLSLEISSMALPHWGMSLAMLLLIGGALLQLSVLGRLAQSRLPSWLWIGILILGVGGEIIPDLSPLPRHLGMCLTGLAFGLCFALEAWQFWRLERQLGKRYPGPLPVIGALASLCFVLRIITLLAHDERYSELGEDILYLLASTATIYNSMGLQIFLLQRSNHALGHLALHDALTGALNRRGLQEQLAQLRKTATPEVCIALLDIDHFKRINDLHGHAAGDEILRQLVFSCKNRCAAAIWSPATAAKNFACYCPA
ncbi:GGDEF domain-containing protein [Chitinibacter sp. FCG-7]|uniref:diguanylate cyclase n=1 Tax=Chitinibacter mangrovi TaxID=3153927 RepID=A0AAU7FBI8_9NEIS